MGILEPYTSTVTVPDAINIIMHDHVINNHLLNPSHHRGCFIKYYVCSAPSSCCVSFSKMVVLPQTTAVVSVSLH